MDLDELKILFKDKYPAPHKSAEELSLMLGSKTRSVMSKIQRSLWIEIIACIIFTVSFAVVSLTSSYTVIQIYFSVFSFFCLLFLPVLFFLMRKTRKLNTVSPIKSNLEEMVKIMREYTKRYFQLTMALIPLSLILALSISSAKTDRTPFIDLTGGQLIFIILYVIIFIISVYFFTKWYLRKLYGDFVDELQELLKELET